MNSFIENVNYLASLDNNYGDGIVLNKSNLSLRNVANDVTLKFSYFNYNTRQIETIVKGIQGMLYTGLEIALQEFVAQIESSLGGNKFDASYSISSSNTGFLIHEFSITINSLDEKLKCTEINFNAKITSTQVEIYNLYGDVINPIKLLAVLALTDDSVINGLNTLGTNIDDIATVADNIVDINTNSDNILNINTTSINIDSVNTVSNNISKVNIVSDDISNVNTVSVNINNVNNVSSISNDIVIASEISDDITAVALIDDNVTIVADNIQYVNTVSNSIANVNTTSGSISNVNTNADNINSINTNASNISSINSIASIVVPNIDEILLVDDRAVQVAADRIIVNNDKLITESYKNTVSVDKAIVASDKIDIASMKLAIETIYDTFDDRFLGTKTIDPTVDNDGNTLIDGALYFNTSSNTLKVYDLGSLIWIQIPQIYLSSLLDVQLSSISTGDIINWNGTKWVNTRTPKFNSIQLNGGTGSEGTISWNTNEGTADLILHGGSTLQVGQENIRTVRNSTASTIQNGRLCMFDGTIGNSGRIKVKPFTAGFNEALYLYGVATQNIHSGSDGIITIEGKIRGIDTTGASVGEVWADEDILYAKPNYNGMMTNIEPADNELKLVVATVIHAHSSGTLEIRFTPFNENMYYTKVQNDILLNSKVDKNANITAGTFKSITVDSKGLVTGGTNPTTLGGYGITDATPSSHIGTTGVSHGVATTSVNGFMSSTDKSKLNNSTSSNTASTIVARDASGNFSAGTITANLTGTASNADLLDGINSSQFVRSDIITTVADGPLLYGQGAREILWLDNLTGTLSLGYGYDNVLIQNNKAWHAGNDGSGSGLDADLLDGSESTFFLQSKSIGNGDVNSILTSGMYRLEAATNSPIGGYGNILSVRGSSSSSPTTLADTIGQIAFNYNTGEHYIRGGQIGSPGGLSYLPTVPWGKILTSITPIGYSSSGVGVGGTAAQGGLKTDTVTLNKLTGKIIMSGSSLVSGASVYFQHNNTMIDTGDVVYPIISSGVTNANNYRLECIGLDYGHAYYRLTNLSGGTLSEQVAFNYVVIKGKYS